MDDSVSTPPAAALEVRAWEIRGTEKVLVAERVRDREGRIRMIWHAEIETLKGFLWLEYMMEDDGPP